MLIFILFLKLIMVLKKKIMIWVPCIVSGLQWGIVGAAAQKPIKGHLV